MRLAILFLLVAALPAQQHTLHTLHKFQLWGELNKIDATVKRTFWLGFTKRFDGWCWVVEGRTPTGRPRFCF